MSSTALLRRRIVAALFVASAACASLVACEERLPLPSGSAPSDEGSTSDGGDGGGNGGDGGADAAVVLRGDRVLGLDVDLSGQTLLEHVQTARDAGATTTAVGYAWDEVEIPYDGGTADASTTLYQPGLHVANLVLSSERVSAILEVDAVDVGGTRMPADLASLPLDDPRVAERYGRVMDYVVAQMPDMTLDVLLVASGVDQAFGDDATRYAALATFIERAQAHATSTGAPFRIGFTVSEGAVTSKRSLLDAAWNRSAVVGVTVLAVDAAGRALAPTSVGDAMDRIVGTAPAEKPILVRAGYPSAAACGSSADAQASFVRASFDAWDRNAARIKVLDLVELDDAPASVVSNRAQRQGRSDETWLALFGSLGFRDGNAGAKASLAEFRAAAHVRGW